MRETVSASRVTCDGCGKSWVEPADTGEEPLGLYIDRVFEIHEGGGNEVTNVFACTYKCVRKAIANAFERDER